MIWKVDLVYHSFDFLSSRKNEMKCKIVREAEKKREILRELGRYFLKIKKSLLTREESMDIIALASLKIRITSCLDTMKTVWRNEYVYYHA